jgi:hypothetical protein
LDGEGEHVRISLRPAINGKILEIGTFKSNPRGPDWTFEHYCLREEEDVAAAVAALLVRGKLK